MLKTSALESIVDLDQKIQDAVCAIPTSDRYVIALSGGLDSIALMHFCLPYLKQQTDNIRAIHVNHGLSSNAPSWAQFCEDVCRGLDVPCDVVNVSVVEGGRGLEAAARQARYAVFERYMSENTVLLQGHHLNDQAETVLMRVLKGLGPEALKGIPQGRSLSKGLLYRPWLSVSRAVLVSAVKKHGLSWVEDESNQDSRYERNYLRNEVLPLLSQRQPAIVQNLGMLAQKSYETSEFIREWCESQQQVFLSVPYADCMALEVNKVKTYSIRQQAFIVRYWLDQLGVSHPAEGNFQRIFDELFTANSDSKAEICWQGNVLRVFNGALFCFSAALKEDAHFQFDMPLADLAEKAFIKSLPHGVITATIVDPSALANPNTVNENNTQARYIYNIYCCIPKQADYLTVRARKGGDKLYLRSSHSSTLKKLYQAHKLLPWHREKLPVLCLDDTLVGTLAGFVGQAFQPNVPMNNAEISNSHLVRFSFELFSRT